MVEAVDHANGSAASWGRTPPRTATTRWLLPLRLTSLRHRVGAAARQLSHAVTWRYTSTKTAASASDATDRMTRVLELSLRR
jgi:hypothetical protein